MGVMPSPNDSAPHVALTRFLRELPNYVVLRNEADLFGNLQRGGDIDLLVGDLVLAERTLIGHLGPPIRIVRSSYVSGYSYDWGHIDLLPTIEWRGACYLQTEAVLEGRQLSPHGRFVPRIAHEALISWLTNLLWGGFFKERYAAEIRQAVENDGSAFRQTLMEVAGKKLGLRLWQAAVDGNAEVSAEWTQSLRRAVWWRACLRSPMRTIQRSVAFVTGELRLRVQPPVPWVAILGWDGSDTSSLANEIVHRFAACPYGDVKVIQWRSHEPTGSGRSRLAPAANWLMFYVAQWARLRAKGYILALDRTYLDVVLDDARGRDRVGSLARALWRVLPQPDLVFVARPEHQSQTGGASASELPVEHVIDARLPLSAVVDEIQRVIRMWMLNRSVASLGAQAPIVSAPTASAVGSSGAPTSVSRDDGTR